MFVYSEFKLFDDILRNEKWIVHSKKNLLKLIKFISYDLSGFAWIF